MLGNLWRKLNASLSIPRHPPRRVSVRRFRPTVEPLEERTVLSLVLRGVPTWLAQGPSPIRFANAVRKANLRTSTDVGAVQAIAVDPNNTAHVFVGTVNGGVWQTQDVNAADPVWTTTTTSDQLGSLSISSIAFDQTSSQVIYAGTGSFSAAAGRGGPAVGIYKSSDGGQTWTLLGKDTFAGQRIIKILTTKLNDGKTVLAATAGGIFRSDDGGTTWVHLEGDGLPLFGNVTDVALNPNNPDQLFVAVVAGGEFRPLTGVYRLDLRPFGEWTPVTGDMDRAVLDKASQIQLAVSPAGENPIWAGVMQGNVLRAVFRAKTDSTAWKSVGPEAGPNEARKGPNVISTEGFTRFSIVADPAKDNLVYVGGETGDESPFGGILTRGDSTHNTWTAISEFVRKANKTPPEGTVNPETLAGVDTAPHADSRQMVFAAGQILEADDGGIYRLSGPEGSKPSWVAANGTGLQNTEIDALSQNSLVAGSQDNGVAFNTGGGNWVEQRSADGVVAFVAPDGTNYASNQNFDAFRFTVSRELKHLDARVKDGLPREGGRFDPLLIDFDKDLPHVTPFRVSAGDANGNLMLIGAKGGVLYLSTNKGDTVTSLGGLDATKTAANAVQARGFDGKRQHMMGTVTVIALGTPGIPAATPAAATPANKGIAYVATDAGEIYRSDDVTRIADVTRDEGDGGFVRTHFSDRAGKGAAPLGLVIDPADSKRVYVLTSTAVFRTDDGGNTWTNLTGILNNPNIALITPNGAVGTALGSIALVKGQGGKPDVLLVGGLGGVFRLSNPASFTTADLKQWTVYGDKMPNVFVDALAYDPQTDTLAAGTLGRGAWQIGNVSQTISTGGLLVIFGTIGQTPDPNNPLNTIWSDGMGNTVNIRNGLAFPVVSLMP
jgi:hypothetical protein